MRLPSPETITMLCNCTVPEGRTPTHCPGSDSQERDVQPFPIWRRTGGAFNPVIQALAVSRDDSDRTPSSSIDQLKATVVITGISWGHWIAGIP